MDAGTLGVLRDIATLAVLTTALGLLAYAFLRRGRPSLGWNTEGRVDSRPFEWVDGTVLLSLILVMISSLYTTLPTAEPAPLPEQSAMAVLAQICFFLLCCSLLLFYLRVVRGLDPLTLFGLKQLGPLKIAGTALLFILPTLVLVNGSANWITEWMKTFWPGLEMQDAVQLLEGSNDPLVKVLMVVAAVVVAPIVEETLFRGCIYGVLKKYTDGYFAALVSAVFFALVHFHVPSFGPLVLLAMVLCLAYEMTGSLLVPMAMHALFNATSVVALLLNLKSDA